MLRELRELFNNTLASSEEGSEDRDHVLRLATATLLIEVVRADREEDLAENRAVFSQLKAFFELSEEETSLLVKEAEEEADHAVSLQTFTRNLHENLSVREKHAVIEMLWRVALADSHLDKHEDHLVRKVAGLLYVSHRDLIRIRNNVRDTGG